MGAWDVGNFGNDDAMDWAGEFEDAPSEKAIRAALSDAADAKGYLESPQASIALAAAEVVAAAHGQPSATLPAKLAAWASAHSSIATPERLAQAIAAVLRVRGDQNSELAELWKDSPDAANWLAEIGNLESRLR